MLPGLAGKLCADYFQAKLLIILLQLLCQLHSTINLFSLLPDESLFSLRTCNVRRVLSICPQNLNYENPCYPKDMPFMPVLNITVLANGLGPALVFIAA